jgi:hypothetical protein
MFGSLHYEIYYCTFCVNIVLGYFKSSSNVQKGFARTPRKAAILKMGDGSELTSGGTGYIQVVVVVVKLMSVSRRDSA